MILKDNASNMTKAMIISMGCVAHTMQLAVNEGLFSQCAVSDAVARGRQIVGHFSHSQLAYLRLLGLFLFLCSSTKTTRLRLF